MFSAEGLILEKGRPFGTYSLKPALGHFWAGLCPPCRARARGQAEPLPGAECGGQCGGNRRSVLEIVIFQGDKMVKWCRLGESNPGPTDYESVALPLS